MQIILLLILAVFQVTVTDYLVTNPDFYQLDAYTWESDAFRAMKLGDVVVKGQLLIAGLYQEVPDPYGPQPDRLYQVAGAARGKVLAKTYREFTVQVEDSVQETQEAGREVRLWAEIFGLRLPLGLWSRTEGETQSWREERRASLLGVELPLALEWETLVRLERRERKLTKEAACFMRN